MKSLQKEQILRLNCPGFGEESFLTIGKARPLDHYSVIVVNPVSILHLFDKDPDAVKEIDGKLDEGLTSYTLKNDILLQSLENDLKKRIFELVNFLEKGGLLVYFLCRPFLVQGEKMAMDNYYWLESLAPDTPTETNMRHMSAVSHGRIIEPTEHAESSDFSLYFKQPGLEWNTIIREENLTEGYIVLCGAGPRKCISAQLIAGDNDGRIVFLPAPYSPDFDRTLVDCLNAWYAPKVEASQANARKARNTGDMPALEPPSTKFQQPDPGKYLSPKGESSQNLRIEPGKPSSSYARLSPVSPTTSKSGLPPVQKFDARVSRSQPIPNIPGGQPPGEPSEEQGEGFPGLGAIESTSTRSRWDRETAEPGSSQLNQPLPEPEEGAPSATELLQDLEGTNEEATEAQPSGYVHPADARQAQKQSPGGQEPPPLTLFEQLSQVAAPGHDFTSTSTNPTFDASEQSLAPGPEATEEMQHVEAEQLAAYEQEEASPAAAEPEPSAAGGFSQPSASRFSTPEPAPSAPNNNHDQDSPSLPEAKDLIKKMDEITKTAAPDWCIEYSFPDLDDLKKERATLQDSIRQTQAKIAALDSKISLLDGLKNALLSAEGDELTNACSRVFKRLGWQAKGTDHADELLLSTDKPDIMCRVTRSTSQAKRSDLVELSASIVNHWGEYEVEPKGLLVACTWANRPPSERVESDYPDTLIEFAKKKSMCLMTTMQLLCMYLEIELGKESPEEIRSRIMETSGRLSGYQLEAAVTRS